MLLAGSTDFGQARRQGPQGESHAHLEAKIEFKFSPWKAGIGKTAQLNKCLHLLVIVKGGEQLMLFVTIHWTG